jgi:peroxiredoxin
MLAVGDRAPGFALTDLEGGRKSLEDLAANGPVLLAFFKVSCPVCQFTFPFLERFHQGKANVVGISQDDAGLTRGFNEEFGITFQVLIDSTGYPASNGFGISHVPSLFVVEQDGTVSWALDGFNKRELADLGARFNVKPFHPTDYVPEWKAG